MSVIVLREYIFQHQFLKSFSDTWIYIRCRCDYQLCYERDVQWKKCSCAQLNENRLFHRTKQIADKSQLRKNSAANILSRTKRIDQIVRNFRERHDCAHEKRWREINEETICKVCNERSKAHILKCSNYLFQACARCKRNWL